MREPLFTPASEAARALIVEDDPSSIVRARDSAALHRATMLAIESAFGHGIDMPVGAVALQDGEIVGRGFAGDVRLRQPLVHAEIMALLDCQFDVIGAKPNTLVVSLEPCEHCQDFFARQPELRRVAFGISRRDAAARGLVKPHREDIFQRANRINLPYEVVQIEDEELKAAGNIILDHVKRDTGTGDVEVDTEDLNAALARFNERAN